VGLPPGTPESVSVITGASSGLGVEIAKAFARRGRPLVLVARRKQRLDELASALRQDYGVRAEPIVCDVADAVSREALLARIEQLGLIVDVLVNNAGYGSSGQFKDLPAATETDMVGVNVEAVVALCAATVPGMASRRRGAVLNVASTISFQPVPGAATYAASKAFVLHFTEALHTELAPFGVTVTALCPGAMRTEFLEGEGVEQGASRLPKQLWVDAAVAAEEGVKGLERGDRVVVPGMFNWLGTLTGRHTPRWLLLRLLSRVANRGD
jgi:short-subunit dehydrogenase